MALAFQFISEAAKREYKALPANVQQDFGYNFQLIQLDQSPLIAFKTLQGKNWSGVVELILKSERSYRCVYCAKFGNTLYVLHSFQKTTNGPDRHAMKITEERYKLIPK